MRISLSSPDPGSLSDGRARGFVRLLYSQNPFYLLSVCFVLHGVGLWYHATRTIHSPWSLLALVGAFIGLLAVTGFTIVRLGQVWDDARSILLTLLILFLELALATDDVLVSDRVTGRWMLLAGWLLSVAVSEFLLIGLRIRLPLLYRIPFHTMLLSLFFYPPTIVRETYPRGDWILPSIFHFSTIIAVNILLLLPAVRRGPDYVRRNGTPWAWPLFPWSLFVVLISVLVTRMYSVAVSLDPVLNLDWSRAAKFENAFGPLFFAPVLLALAMLFWERASQNRSSHLSTIGIALSFLSIAMAWPPNDHGLYGHLYLRLQSAAGSPIWLSMIGAALVSGYGSVRGARFAVETFTVILVALGFVGPQSVDWAGLTEPQPIPFLVLSGLALNRSLQRRSSFGLFAATVAFGLAIWPAFALFPIRFRVGLSIDLLIVAAGCSAMLFRDRHASYLRLFASTSIGLATLVAVWARLSDGIPGGMCYAQLAVLAGVSFVFYLRFRSTVELRAALTSGFACVPLALWDAANLVLGLPGGVGLLWITAGLVSFGTGTGISLFKVMQRSRASAN